MIDQTRIRNFAIVAHIDHGKSTLADRLLEMTGTIQKRDMMEQILDSNPIERERGITIKLAPVCMHFAHQGKTYTLNLIDTQGHVDFSYEVSRSLAACEGVILVVDATQGVQAQTLAHMQLIVNKNLTVIPVINKIDLPTANVSQTRQELIDTFHFAAEDILEISAKTGAHVEKVLEAIVKRIPCPTGNPLNPLKALIFSSKFDAHRGVIVYTRIIDGAIDIHKIRRQIAHNTTPIKFFATNTAFLPLEVGCFAPEMKVVDQLTAGEVGYIATGLKEVLLARVGDTIVENGSETAPLPGYREPKAMVYVSLFPTDNDAFNEFREALEKLHLSDSSFTYQPISSPALGKGYQCGFLGLLHAEVVKERLENEYSLDLIASAPTVEYEITKTDGSELTIHSTQNYPEPTTIREVREPFMLVTIYTPSGSIGPVMQLCQEKRAESGDLEYVANQAKLTYVIPLSEMIRDFFDRLKSITSGYASLDYEFYEYRPTDAVKLDIYINKTPAEAFSQIIVRQNVQSEANRMVDKLKDLIPRHQFQIPIQALIGGKIIARSDVKSFRKDVTAKLYGGDQTRKDKLLEAQKKGKKKMRRVGMVEIPKEVFLNVFKQT